LFGLDRLWLGLNKQWFCQNGHLLLMDFDFIFVLRESNFNLRCLSVVNAFVLLRTLRLSPVVFFLIEFSIKVHVMLQLVLSAFLSDILIRFVFCTAFIAFFVIFMHAAEVFVSRIFFFRNLRLGGLLFLFGSCCFEQGFELDRCLFLF